MQFINATVKMLAEPIVTNFSVINNARRVIFRHNASMLGNPAAVPPASGKKKCRAMAPGKLNREASRLGGKSSRNSSQNRAGGPVPRCCVATTDAQEITLPLPVFQAWFVSTAMRFPHGPDIPAFLTSWANVALRQVWAGTGRCPQNDQGQNFCCATFCSRKSRRTAIRFELRSSSG